MSESPSEPITFAEVNERLARIADEVHDKDLSLEKSLDLYEEAVRLSNDALLIVQKPTFSPEESATLATLRAGDPLAEESMSPADASAVASGAPGAEQEVPGTGPQAGSGATPGGEDPSGSDGPSRDPDERAD